MAQVDHVPRADAPFPVYSFGAFKLDTGRGALTRSGQVIRLRPKAFEVLRYLLEHPGRVVSRDELIEAVWSPAIVTDGALAQCLIGIRRALGTDGRDLIETVPRRGYLMKANVTVEASHAGAAVAKPRSRHWLILASVMITAVTSFVWWSSRPAVEREAALPVSIAVMPFLDVSPEGNQEYLCDGLAEDILTLLASSPGLRVTARTSSFALRSETLDVPAIARRLGVSYVLEGSVRSWGDRVRVTAQLIDAESGMHRWSEAYDRVGSDVLALELEIATAVAEALRVELAPPERRSEVDPRAYALMRQAQHLRFTDRPDLQQAEALLHRSIDIQPDFVSAYVQLAFTYLDLELSGFYAVGGGAEIDEIRWQRIEAPLEKARSVDPHDTGVNILSGLIARWRSHDLASAVRYYQLAIESSPGIYEPDYLPLLVDLYQIDEAIEYGEYLAISNPLCTPCLHTLAKAYLLAGRFDDAERATAQMQMLQPGWRSPQAGEIQLYRGNPAKALELFDEVDVTDADRTWGRIIALHRVGRLEEFEAEFDAFRARWGRKMPDAVAHIYASIGNPDAAFDWLDKLDRYVASRGEANFHDFYWSELTPDPRWRRFQEKWGVAPAQLARYRIDIEIPRKDRTSDPFP